MEFFLEHIEVLTPILGVLVVVGIGLWRTRNKAKGSGGSGKGDRGNPPKQLP